MCNQGGQRVHIVVYQLMDKTWMAYFKKNGTMCESGTTKAEAIGKLLLTYEYTIPVKIETKEN